MGAHVKFNVETNPKRPELKEIQSKFSQTDLSSVDMDEVDVSLTTLKQQITALTKTKKKNTHSQKLMKHKFRKISPNTQSHS